MYLKEIYLENTGPISRCHVELPFAGSGNPLPVVIVGPNGSGKSIFLSYIVDALMELAKQAFDNIMSSNDSGGTPYFRVIHPGAIRSRESFSLSLLHFKTNDDNLYYCEKAGLLESATYSPSVQSVFTPIWDWPTEESHKCVSTDKKEESFNFSTGKISQFAPPSEDVIRTEMRKGVYAFFPTSRHEQPIWLNPKGLKVEPDAFPARFKRQLEKPLWIETCAAENIGWILEVYFDAGVDFDTVQSLKVNSSGVFPDNLSEREKRHWSNLPALQLSRRNIEQILQEVLQDDQAKLLRRYRTNSEHRFFIQLGNEEEIPSLQSLSEGQSQLFHLFMTIIRYGERDNLNMSIRLSEITGLVVIDEIASHLHPTLQHDVLPKLIKLFPKVQFIVSSHSPLFLLGMEKEFGPDGLDILELPEGRKTDSERFSEFGKAFEYYQNTERFESEIKQLIAEITKPVVMTEGKLDVRYIQTALELLGEEELLNSLEIRPVGKKGKKGDEDGGKDGLNRVLNFHKKDSSLMNQPMLLLYDCETSKEPDEIEKLWVRSISHNPKNTKVKKGIENLFPADLFEKRFYKTEVKEGDYGEHNTITEFRKKEFCDWICEERRNSDDFEEFREVVEILKEFVKFHQSHLD